MKKVSFIVSIIISTLIAAQIAGCSSIDQRKLVRKCIFAIVDINVRSITLAGLAMGLDLSITNPNNDNAVIDKMDLHLFIEDVRTVHVTLDKVTVPPGKTKTVTAAVDVPYSAVGMSLSGKIRNRGKIQYRLAGTAYVDTSLGVIELPVTISKN